jgi:hypothetical protein
MSALVDGLVSCPKSFVFKRAFEEAEVKNVSFTSLDAVERMVP